MAACTSRAPLDPGDYPTGVAISKERFAALPLERHAIHGTWNYTLSPRPASSGEAALAGEAGGPARHRQAMLARLADPRLTGMNAANDFSRCLPSCHHRHTHLCEHLACFDLAQSQRLVS